MLITWSKNHEFFQLKGTNLFICKKEHRQTWGRIFYLAHKNSDYLKRDSIILNEYFKGYTIGSNSLKGRWINFNDVGKLFTLLPKEYSKLLIVEIDKLT